VKVRFTAPADADFEAIGDWIAQDDPQRAGSFIRELREAAAALGRYPRRYPTLPGAPAEVRKKSYRQYLILYRVREREVQILRVGHGSRDWTAILSEASQ
jgi:toxin ParE1/3/4